ncbi:MAG: 2-amino-4-hydroxy-6-hydroxymethyldihydropteridine diphosphokinase [Sedimentisphaerales bacterium]|nr:2-amino-4-hydroxy-6-hydroxymethyldihydropteridine diphosphokinase [Sedimentisphaerales bacterium]
MILPTYKTAYIGIGSNLGDRARTIAQALALLNYTDMIWVVQVAGLVETDPIGGPAGQGSYLNSVAQLHSCMSARELLQFLHRIEARLGRTRRRRWGPRSIDLDLLLFEDQVIREPDIQVPHPRMHERRFVMAPLAQIAPHLVHPVLHKTVRQILAELD